MTRRMRRLPIDSVLSESIGRTQDRASAHKSWHDWQTTGIAFGFRGLREQLQVSEQLWGRRSCTRYHVWE